MAGGCDAIVNIECGATNMAALKAYRSQAGNDPAIKTALDCLQKRCSILPAMKLYDSEVPEISQSQTAEGVNRVGQLALFAFFVSAISMSAWSLWPRRRSAAGDEIDAGDMSCPE